MPRRADVKTESRKAPAYSGSPSRPGHQEIHFSSGRIIPRATMTKVTTPTNARILVMRHLQMRGVVGTGRYGH